MPSISPLVDIKLFGLPISGRQRSQITDYLIHSDDVLETVNDLPQPFRSWVEHPQRIRRLNRSARRAARLDHKTDLWLETLR